MSPDRTDPSQNPAGRYHRQMLLPDIGDAGQQRLSAARVLIIGCGALGCGVADLLARAGVGTLRIVDRDIVEETNLQRQVLFCQADADSARPKAIAAAERLRAINPIINIEPLVDDFRAANAGLITTDMDMLIDGLDNFDGRYLLNDIAAKYHLPYIYAGAVGTGGVVMPVLPRGCPLDRTVRWTNAQATPCLRCVFPEPPPAGSTPTCDTAGVLGPTIAAVIANQAAAAMSMLVGRMDGFDRSLHSIDPWKGEDRRLHTGSPRDDCPCCHDRVFEWLEHGRGRDTSALCGREMVQILPSSSSPLDLAVLAQRLTPHGTIKCDEHTLRIDLTQESTSITVFADGRALIGLADPAAARTLFDRYIGS